MARTSGSAKDPSAVSTLPERSIISLLHHLSSKVLIVCIFDTGGSGLSQLENIHITSESMGIQLTLFNSIWREKKVPIWVSVGDLLLIGLCHRKRIC